jgi:hypothetical protein
VGAAGLPFISAPNKFTVQGAHDALVQLSGHWRRKPQRRRRRYAPEMERRLRSRLKPTTDSWRVDETYIRVKGKWRYLYRAVDSSGATLDFLLSAKQDAAATKRFLAKALGRQNHPVPRVINTDGHSAYPPAIVRWGRGPDADVLSRFTVTAAFIITHLLVKLPARHSVSIKQRIYIRVVSSD